MGRAFHCGAAEYAEEESENSEGILAKGRRDRGEISWTWRGRDGVFLGDHAGSRLRIDWCASARGDALPPTVARHPARFIWGVPSLFGIVLRRLVWNLGDF